MSNIILSTDSYKLSHAPQYPKGTTGVFSYTEPRGGKFKKSVVYGPQAYAKEMLSNPVSIHDINEAESIIVPHRCPFNKAGWKHILNKHGGYLPLHIKTVPEGTVVPISNAVGTIENTDPKTAWLSSYVETPFLRATWYGTTVATISWEIKQLILSYLEKTGTPDDIYFKLHDFGARGVSSAQSAAIGGSAHLVNFMGTDNVESLSHVMRYYNTKNMPGFSIPASEHSTITAWGKEFEVDAYRNMLNTYKSNGIFACVIDSYNPYHAVEKLWGEELRQEVIDSGATVVLRPDSGDPVEVNVKIIQILADKFGTTANLKGFKVLKHVRLIQGDGVNYDTIKNILDAFVKLGFSADNIAFGMGGALLQGMDRDTQQWAMKCSAMQINGQWNDVFKDPSTDVGKQSKRGRLQLVKTSNGGYQTVKEGATSLPNELTTLYKNGELFNEQTFEDVRINSEK